MRQRGRSSLAQVLFLAPALCVGTGFPSLRVHKLSQDAERPVPPPERVNGGGESKAPAGFGQPRRGFALSARGFSPASVRSAHFSVLFTAGWRSSAFATTAQQCPPPTPT